MSFNDSFDGQKYDNTFALHSKVFRGQQVISVHDSSKVAKKGGVE
jgi:hypothetical protein